MSLLSPFGPFLQHLAAYGASEVAAKASRLLVVVAVARALDPAAIGVAAAALAISEILKSLTENGVVQKIIATGDNDLAAACNSAQRIVWLWCGGLMVLQLALATGTYLITGNAMLAGMIALLGLEYLFMPGGLVQCALAMRAGKMRETAAISGAQIVSANLLSALLAIFWASPLALVLPKLLTAPVWLIAMRRLHPWQRTPQAGYAPLRPFLGFGSAVLGVELVRALRMQADKILIGALLGAETLGLYFMAFNAGLGLATSFSVAFSTVLFPHLCGAADRDAAVRQALFLGIGLIAPVVILQAALAPYYVPVLYGQGWEDISQIVSILCLAAIPGVIWAAAAQWLRAHDRPQDELVVSVVLTAALTANTVLLAPFGLVAIVSGYLAVATAIQLGAALWVLAPALKPLTPKSFARSVS